MFLGLNTGAGTGDMFKIDGRRAPAASVVKDLNAGSAPGTGTVDISSLAIEGNSVSGMVLAGAATGAQVYFSKDGGTTWDTAVKPPSGSSITGVLFGRDYARNKTLYASTAGTESGLSVSRDSAVTWDQLSLVDSDITSIRDMALSPDYEHDGTLFIVTNGSKPALWRTVNGGTSWERLFSGAFAGVDALVSVWLSPGFSQSRGLFLTGTAGSSAAIWKSTDGGRRFIRLNPRDPTTGNIFSVDAFITADDTTLFAGSRETGKGLIYRSKNGGVFFDNKSVAGTRPIYSLALSPVYQEDKTVLVGNENGEVFISTDEGVTFSAVPSQSASPPLTGLVSVVFDPGFARNRIIYAASSTADKGIFRFTVGRSTGWESIDDTLPTGATMSNMVFSGSGILYATNVQAVDGAAAEGGIERCLDPTLNIGIKFETVTRGFRDANILKNLRLSGNRLWAIETVEAGIFTYTDSLTVPPRLNTPADKSGGVPIAGARLDWQTLDGATSYHWEVSTETGFDAVASNFKGDVTATSAILPALEFNTTYHWRVRATQPTLSPWSEKRSFSTGLGTELPAAKLLSP
jgi:hypothetical protein